MHRGTHVCALGPEGSLTTPFQQIANKPCVMVKPPAKTKSGRRLFVQQAEGGSRIRRGKNHQIQAFSLRSGSGHPSSLPDWILPVSPASAPRGEWRSHRGAPPGWPTPHRHSAQGSAGCLRPVEPFPKLIFIAEMQCPLSNCYTFFRIFLIFATK